MTCQMMHRLLAIPANLYPLVQTLRCQLIFPIPAPKQHERIGLFVCIKCLIKIHISVFVKSKCILSPVISN